MQEITGPVVAVGEGDEERSDPVPVVPMPTDGLDDPTPMQRQRRALFAGEEVSAQQLLLQAGGPDLAGLDETLFYIVLLLITYRAGNT